VTRIGTCLCASCGAVGAALRSRWPAGDSLLREQQRLPRAAGCAVQARLGETAGAVADCSAALACDPVGLVPAQMWVG
jgi:hypothetical protein